MIVAWLTALAAPAIEDVELQLGLLEDRRAELVRAVETRAGFERHARELALYEEALYAYLVGDPAEAALGFHVLLHLGSADPSLRDDALWYLAKSYQKMGFHELAAERLEQIASSAHPLRDEALVALVQLRAEAGPPEAFRDVYERSIRNARIRSTSALQYQLGKALYTLEQFQDAEQVLRTVSFGGSHGIRARYVRGVIALRSGDRPGAQQHFIAASEAFPVSEAERHARDLAILAVARLHHAEGAYREAAAWYGRIGPDSKVLDQASVEGVWTQVALEDWGEALLRLGYLRHLLPHHRERARLQFLEAEVLHERGDLDGAEVGYGRSAAHLESVVERLQLLDLDAISTERLLLDPLRWRPGEGLPPPWALGDLVDADGFMPALVARRGARWVREQLDATRRLVVEIREALDGGGAVGRFQVYRQEVDAQLDVLLQLRVAVLLHEVDRLVQSGGIGRREAKAQRERLEGELERLVERTAARAERYTRVGELRADRRALRRQLEVQEVEATRTLLRAVEAELFRLEEQRRALPYTAEELAASEALRASIHGLRPADLPLEPSPLHPWIDQQIEEVAALRQQIDAAEEAALRDIDATLDDEVQRLEAIERVLIPTEQRVARMWTERSRAGRAAVVEAIAVDAARAEGRLGDVAWARLLETRDRIERLQEERQRLEERLERRYRYLRLRVDGLDTPAEAGD